MMKTERMTFAEQQRGRGYFVPYRPDTVNACPGCGQSNWWIGRTMAECAGCGVALDLLVSARGSGSFIAPRSSDRFSWNAAA